MWPIWTTDRRNPMQYVFMLLAVAGITALDQWTKYLTVQNIPLYD